MYRLMARQRKRAIRITKAQSQELTPLVRLAVQRQIECWEFESQIEGTLGAYFENLEDAIADWAAAGDPEKIEDQDVIVILKGLRVER